MYAFGSGLSYTTFAITQAKTVANKVGRGSDVQVTCTVKNTGKTAGAEVVQLYVHSAHAPVARPEKELKGFAKVELAPGESREVTLTLTPQDFAYWDVATHNWSVAPGAYTLLIGDASDKISAKTTVTLE